MKVVHFKIAGSLLFSTLATLGIHASVLSQPSLAQYQDNADPLRDFNRREVDAQGGNGLNQDMLLDLLHQVQQGNFDIDYQAVQQRQQQSIQDAATEFREKQRQMLQQQNMNTPETDT